MLPEGHLPVTLVVHIHCPSVTYIVEEVSPAFHGDTLEDGQHGEQDVVELRDPVVGPFPVGLAFGPVGAGTGGFLCPTRSRGLTLNVICEREGEERQDKDQGNNGEIRTHECLTLLGETAIGVNLVFFL